MAVYVGRGANAAVPQILLASFIKFNRSKTDNAFVKTQSLQNLLEAGVHPRIALASCGMFSDPEQMFVDSEEYMGKWKKATNMYVENLRLNSKSSGKS